MSNIESNDREKIVSHHPFSSECPWVVYIFFEDGVLRTFPTHIRLQIGQGIGWVLLKGVGEFQVDFEEESPFEKRHFDQHTPWSGPARKQARATCSVTCRAGTAELEIEVLPLAADLQPKHVQVSLHNNQIVVNPHTVHVWSGIDTVWWHGEEESNGDAHEVKISFKDGSPFEGGNKPISGHPAKSKKTKSDAKPDPYRYQYTVEYRDCTLDPDVVVDPPPKNP